MTPSMPPAFPIQCVECGATTNLHLIRFRYHICIHCTRAVVAGFARLQRLRLRSGGGSLGPSDLPDPVDE